MPDVFEEDQTQDVFEEDEAGDIFEEDFKSPAPSPSPAFTKEDALSLPPATGAFSDPSRPAPPLASRPAPEPAPLNARRDSLDAFVEATPGVGTALGLLRRVSGMEGFSPTKTLQEKVVTPGVEAFQSGPGRRIAETAVPVVSKALEVASSKLGQVVLSGGTNPGLAPSLSPAASNLLAREGLTWLSGDFGPTKPREDDPAVRQGVTDLEQSLGSTGAAFAQGLAHEGGKLPLYLTPTGAGGVAARILGKAAAEAPLLTRLLSSAVPVAAEGATQGALQGLATKGADVGTYAGAGGLMAGALGAAPVLAGEVPRVYRFLAGEQEMQQLGRELIDVVQKALPAPEALPRTPRAPAPQKPKLSLEESIKQGASTPTVKLAKETDKVSPLVTTVYFDPKKEQFALRAIEVNKRHGIRVKDFIVKNSAAAAELSSKKFPQVPHQPPKLLGAVEVGMDVGVAEADNMSRALLERSRTKLAAGVEPTEVMGPDTPRITVDDRPAFSLARQVRNSEDTLFTTVPQELRDTYFGRASPFDDMERIYVMGATDADGNIQARALKRFRAGEPSFDELQLRELEQVPQEKLPTAPPQFAPMWMKQLPEVSVNTVMGKTGKGPAEAQAFLDELVDRGVLKPKPDGGYTNTEVVVPEHGTAGERRAIPVAAPNGATPGTFVYVKSPSIPESAYRDGPNGGRFAYAIFRGKAPNGKFRVQFETSPGSGQTRTAELTADEFNSALPPGLGDVRLANLPAVYGETRPMPWVWPPQTQQAFVEATNATNKLFRNPTLLGGGRGQLAEIAEAVSSKLLPGFKRGNPLSRELFLRAASNQKNFNSERIRLAEYMSKLTGRHLTGAESKMLLDYGKLSPAQRAQTSQAIFATPVGKQMKAGVDALLAGKDADSAWLASRGFEGVAALERLRSLGEADRYVANAYANFVDPKEWLKVVEGTDAWDKAIGWLMKNGAQSTGDAVASLRAAMHAASPEEALLKYATKASGKGHLKHRTQLPPELAKVLGRLESGPIQLAETIAATKTLRRQVEIWDAVAESPFASRGPMHGFSPTPLPQDPVYGKAAGMYVHPDFLKMTPQALANLASDASGVFGAGSSIMKYNFVVMNPVAWIRNAARTLRGFMFSGVHDDPLSMVDALDSLLAEKADPGGFGRGALVAEARQNGTLSPAFSAIEQGAGSDALKRKLFSELRTAMGKGGTWRDALFALGRLKANTKVQIRQSYEFFDTFAKLSAYAAQRRYATNTLGFNPNEAAAYASKWVNDAFPNYDVMSPLATAARDRGTVVAPFAPAASEDLRVLASMGGRALQDPRAARFMLQYVAALGATYWAIKGMARAAGITEAEERIATQAQPNYTRAYYSPFSVALPVRGPKGELQLQDPIYDLEPIVGWTRGMPQEDWWQRGLRNITQEFLGQDGQSQYGTMALKTLESTGVLPSYERPSRPVGFGEGGLSKGIQAGAQLGLLPSGLTRGLNAYNATREKNRPGEVLSPGAATARAVLPIHQATPEIQKIRSVQEMQAFDARIKGEIKSLIRSLPKDAKPEEVARLQALIQEKMRVLAETLQDFKQRMSQ